MYVTITSKTKYSAHGYSFYGPFTWAQSTPNVERFVRIFYQKIWTARYPSPVTQMDRGIFSQPTTVREYRRYNIVSKEHEWGYSTRSLMGMEAFCEIINDLELILPLYKYIDDSTTYDIENRNEKSYRLQSAIDQHLPGQQIVTC